MQSALNPKHLFAHSRSLIIGAGMARKAMRLNCIGDDVTCHHPLPSALVVPLGAFRTVYLLAWDMETYFLEYPKFIAHHSTSSHSSNLNEHTCVHWTHTFDITLRLKSPREFVLAGVEVFVCNNALSRWSFLLDIFRGPQSHATLLSNSCKMVLRDWKRSQIAAPTHAECCTIGLDHFLAAAGVASFASRVI